MKLLGRLDAETFNLLNDAYLYINDAGDIIFKDSSSNIIRSHGVNEFLTESIVNILIESLT